MKTNTTIYATVHVKSLQQIFVRLDDEPRSYDLRINKASLGVVNIRLEVRQADTDHFTEILKACGEGATK